MVLTGGLHPDFIKWHALDMRLADRKAAHSQNKLYIQCTLT